MTVGASIALRNNRLNQIIAALDAGVSGALINIYDGAKPGTPGAAITTQTLLGTLVMSDPSFPAPVNGSMAANPITQDSVADATGTATWARVTDSAGTFVIDVNAALAAAEIILDSVDIIAGGIISLNSFVISEGNATN